MPVLSIYVSDETYKRLNTLGKEDCRTIEDLATCAVEETALASFRHRKDDPGRKHLPPICGGVRCVSVHTGDDAYSCMYCEKDMNT